jgi:Fe-S cluster biogenesis protein NfuA
VFSFIVFCEFIRNLLVFSRTRLISIFFFFDKLSFHRYYVFHLLFQGNCGSCPSSTQTMKMGLERGLREKIPEIQEVIQAMPNGPDLCQEEIDVVLNGVRPFLQVAGGSIDLDKITGLDGTQPTVILKMGGSSASLASVKLEIQQRLQRHFMMAGLRIDWS